MNITNTIEYKSPIQKVVVEARIKDGYIAEQLPSGNIELIKGRHYMIIDSQGFDVFVNRVKNYGI